MSKYFVIYNETENVYEPPYDQNDKGGYHSITRDVYAFVDSLDDLFQYSKKNKVQYFEVARELKPTFETKTTVRV